MDDRLERQLAFILEIDRLKTILRQTLLLTERRQENDAEHSWHIAMMALLLAEHADRPVNVARVVKMLPLHDLVEIDAGDTFIYDEAGHHDKEERERKAADRLFGLLPADQGAELRELWEEFEARTSDDARFAAAVDRLQPLLHNVHTQGDAWRRHGVTADRVLARNAMIGDGSARLWALARRLITEAMAKGHLAPPPSAPPTAE